MFKINLRFIKTVWPVGFTIRWLHYLMVVLISSLLVVILMLLVVVFIASLHNLMVALSIARMLYYQGLCMKIKPIPNP